jgi:hypothetical protein
MKRIVVPDREHTVAACADSALRSTALARPDMRHPRHSDTSNPWPR